MNRIVKKITSLSAAFAVMFTSVFVFNMPEKSAAAEDGGTHSHKVCVGSGHNGCTHEAIEFEPFPEFSDGTIQPVFRAKSYYLTKNYVLDDEGRIFIEKGVTNLCLNGYSIMKNGGQIIDVNQIGDLSAELNICDCTGNGMIKNTSADDGWDCISVIDDSVLNLYSGTIDGGTNGSGISVHRTTGTKGSTANIYGGKVRCKNGIAVYTQDPDTSLNVYGGEISSSDYYTIYVEDERNAVSVYGGKITGSAANPYSTVMIMGDGAYLDIKGGEVIGKNYSAVYCHANSTLRISDGVVKSESTANTCIHNIGTLIVSGGTVSGGGNYGIRNYRGSANATISGGTVSCKGTSIYNYDNAVFEINGGEITSESGNGISNRSALTVSGGTVSGNIALRNYDNGATATISGGQLSCKGDFGIWNYNGGALNITDGKVSGGEYCLYNQEGTITISGGVVSAKSNYALYNEEKGTAVINGGTLNSTFSPVANYGTLNISGGSFGAENPSTTTYMINQKNMNLSVSPVFRNSAIWLKTDDNIGITGELVMSEPCPVYIESYVPRIFTSGWDTHMQGKKPSDYFKSPYADAKIIYRDNEAVMVYYYKITYDANGGNCSVQSAETDISGKLASLAVPTREGYSFDGWFTEETGGEKITTDTAFTDDATIYAHWTCNDHIGGDTYENDDTQHWQVCSKCGVESEKSNHTWDDGEETTPPTETTEGVKTYKCTVCNAEKTEEIDKLDHTHTYSDEWTSNESGHWHAATCGHNVKDSEAKHNFGTPTVTPSICTQQGSEEYICDTCGYKKTVTLDFAEHSFDGEWQKDAAKHWKVCTVCNTEKSEEAAHTWDNGTVTKQPTESETGVKTYACTVCSAEKTEKIEKLPHEHTYSDKWTSDESGHWHASTCGHDVKDSEAEHYFGTPTVTPSTCTRQGSEEYVCETCDYKKTVTLDLAEHSFDGEWQKDGVKHWKVCTVCNTEKSEEAAHIWDSGETAEQPTENEAGVMLHTCTVCKATKTEPIAPLEHTHDWSGEWSKDDTYHWHDCLKGCGEKNDNTAHIWDDGTVTKQPAADTEGERTFECTVCGKIKTEAIPPTDEPDSGKVSIDVKPGENAPATKLKTPFDELADMILTPEEQELLKKGIDIKIILIVNDAADTAVPDDKAKVEAAIRGLSDYKLGQYLDFNLLKIIGDSEGIKLTRTKKPITVTFEIPAALRGKAEYSVIRVHDGEAEALNDLDSDPDTVTIATDKFSTYALVYKERNTTSVPDDSSDPPTSMPDESDNSGDDNPSGDNVNPSTGIAVSLVPLAAALAAVMAAAKHKKK